MNGFELPNEDNDVHSTNKEDDYLGIHIELDLVCIA